MKGRTGTLATLACGFVAFGLAGSIAAVLWASGSSTRVPRLPACRTLGISCAPGHLGPGFAQGKSAHDAGAGVGPGSRALGAQQSVRPSEAVGTTAPSTAGRPERQGAENVVLTDKSTLRTSSGSHPASATLTSQDSPLPRAPGSATTTSSGSHPASATLTSQDSPAPSAHAGAHPAATSLRTPRPLAPPAGEHGAAGSIALSHRHVVDRHRSRSHGTGAAVAGPVSRREVVAAPPPPPPPLPRHVVTPVTRGRVVSELGVRAGRPGPSSRGVGVARLGRVPLHPSTPPQRHPARQGPPATGVTAGVAGNSGGGNSGGGNSGGGKANSENAIVGNTIAGNSGGGNAIAGNSGGGNAIGRNVIAGNVIAGNAITGNASGS